MLFNKSRSRRSVRIGQSYHCEALEERSLLSAVSLVKDINTGTLGNTAQPLVRIGNLLYFSEDDGVDGLELYRTDGTAAGTVMLQNNFPGSDRNPGVENQAAALNNKCYFISTTGNATYLAVSDGTAVGTTMVKQLDVFAGAPVSSMVAVGQKIYFTMSGTLGNTQLWVSDGTADGTQPLGQIVPALASQAVSNLQVLNSSQIIFTIPSNNSAPIFVSDGTLSGTHQVSTGTTYYTALFVCNGRALFSTPAGALISTDGTTSAAIQTLNSSISVSAYTSNATVGYFIGNNTLYKTNGTTAGTTSVTALVNPTTSIGLLNNGSAVFEEWTAPNSNVVEVMRSDGTSAGTVQLTTFPYIGNNTLTNFAAVGSYGLFNIPTSNIDERLWTTDGTAANTKALFTNIFAMNFLGGGGSPAYFSATDSTHGTELWKSDGTLAGTSMVADVDVQAAGSFPSPLVAINGKYWFYADSQPWVTDLTTAGTVAVNTNPASFTQDDYNFIGLSLGSKVYFRGVLPSNRLQYLYSSTGSGVSQVVNSAGYPSYVTSPVVFNNAIYMVGNGSSSYQLWKTDGTTAGTVVVTGSPTLESLGWGSLAVAGGLLYFSGSDGTLYCMNTAGQITTLTKFTGAANGLLQAAIAFNGQLYFVVGQTSGLSLWQSNGTAAGTKLVRSFYNGIPDGTKTIVVSGSTLYITATVQITANATGPGIFKSDGTAAGTTQNAIFGGSYYGEIPFNGKLFYDSGSLYLTDGTYAGTTNVIPAGVSYVGGAASLVGNYVYFPAADAAHGTELWRTDGTLAGTSFAVDINPGPGSSNPGAVAQFGNALYLSANDGIHNNELMKILYQDSVLGTTGADAITLTQDTDHAHIDWRNGTDSGQLAITDPSGLTIYGNGGADTVTLVATNGNPLPNNLHLIGTFTLNGLSGANPLANTNLDIGSSTVLIPYATAATDPLSTLRGYLKNGYNAGAWTGNATATTGAITSSTAAANTSKTTGIGYADSAEGLVSLPANTIELMYTLYGDTALTGSVGFADFMRMTQHYTLTGQTWAKGDFNYDGTVDSNDFNLLQPNYGQTLPTPAPAPAPVPVLTPIFAAPVTPVVLPVTDADPTPVSSPVDSSGTGGTTPVGSGKAKLKTKAAKPHKHR